MLVGLLALAAAPCPSAEGAQTCEVTIAAESQSLLGGLELRVDYSSAPGDFAGIAEEVACAGLAPGALQTARDDDAGRELRLGLASATGVLTPQDLWRCSFDAPSAAPTADDFSLVLHEALDPHLVPVLATASISAVACPGDPVCGNGVIDAGEECDDGGPSVSCNGGCELTHNSHRCLLRIEATGQGSIGGIQFEVDYSLAGGRFEGEDVGVDCSSPVDAALTAVRDADDEEILSLALISAASLALPVAVFECVFTSEAVALDPGLFQFTDIVAVDEGLRPVSIDLSTSAHQCVSGPYCGDGDVDPEETCDDGNLDPTDACTNACQPAVCGDGIVRLGVEQCDGGGAGNCCAANCTFAAAAVVCRASGGICDPAELCSGSSTGCPADARSTTVCRPSAGVCDLAEVCNGSAVSCPADQFQPQGSACTSDGNVCTTDQCSNGQCLHPNNTEPCDDGNPETSGDTCQNGICVGSGGDPVCGDADGNGSVSAVDALRVLRHAVGQPTSCPLVVCDTDNNGGVQASDAQRVLRKAVGQNVVLNCPPAT